MISETDGWVYAIALILVAVSIFWVARLRSRKNIYGPQPYRRQYIQWVDAEGITRYTRLEGLPDDLVNMLIVNYQGKIIFTRRS